MKNHRIKITSTILNLIAEIDEFKGLWSLLKNMQPDKLNQLKKVATIESVASSTRIEGSKLSDAEVEKLLFGLETHSLKSRDEEEVVGYSDLMNIIFESYSSIPLTENHIKQLHSILLQHSSKDIKHRGKYKTLPNDVQAFDSTGKSVGIIFATATPFETPLKMTELVKWTDNQFSLKTIHPLLVMATFIVHFLAIHPFQDGNGRLSRALTTLLLLKYSYVYAPYSSLEAVIEQQKNQYYLALRQSQKKLFQKGYNINPWIKFFLNSLKAQKNNLKSKMDQLQMINNLPELSQKILELTKSLGQITLSEAISKINTKERTIRDHLYRLSKAGYLIKHGNRKSTFYTIGNFP
ncbi:Fic family protein [Candidatus Margulisiibacteriota bacterium]